MSYDGTTVVGVDDADDLDRAPSGSPDFDEVVAQVRARCLALPGTYEEPAWVGVRWRIRTRTFAHVLDVIGGHPPSYARAAGTDGPVIVLMFRSDGDELEALRHSGPPFFTTPWRRDEIGMRLTADADWDEVAELITESFRLLAPKKLGGADTGDGDLTQPQL